MSSPISVWSGPEPATGSPGRRLGAPPIADVGLTVVLAALLLPISGHVLTGLTTRAPWTTAVVVAIVVLHGSVLLRRSAPVLGYAAACAAMLVVVAAPNGHSTRTAPNGLVESPMLFLPSTVVFLAVLYSVSERGGRRIAVAALGTAGCGVGLSLIRISPAVPAGYPVWQYRIYLTLAMLLAVGVAWGLGVSRAALTARAAEQRAEATRAAVRGERSRIARDMHDVVAHSLAVIVRQAEGGALVAERSPERAAKVLRTIADVGRESLDDMRGLLGVLREPGPEEAALARPEPGPSTPRPTGGPAPQTRTRPTLADLPGIVDRVRGAGLQVEITERGTADEIGGATELAAHHMVREALTNAVKHAGPGTRVEVVLDWLPDALVVEVRDDGGGTHPPVPGAGAGLRGLAERITAVGGSLVAVPVDRGFVVRAVLPVRASKGAS